MKKIITFFLFISLVSCKNSISFESIIESNNIENIKLKRKEIVASQQDFSNKLKIIDNKLEELNTNPQLPIVEIFKVIPYKI